MVKRIKVIIPVIDSKWWQSMKEPHIKEIEKYKDPDTSLDFVNISKGPETIESSYDSAWSAIFTLKEAEKAEQDGYDGLIIHCFGDPGLRAAKEAVAIPVVGIGEASVIFALLLSDKFGILTVGPTESSSYLRDNLKIYGLDHKCVDILSIGMPVLDLKEESEQEIKLLIDLGQKMIKKGADTLILGCGSLLGIEKDVSNKLGIPIILPTAAALKMCEAMILIGVSQSKRRFYPPTIKKRTIN